ncbi:MAG: class I SAM-dependent methyltransferase [Mycobacterium sp.]
MTTHDAEGGRYFAADAEADDELARLKLLEAVCDPWTFRYLDGIGVRKGWRCLEVGAGAGSVVRWLSERVGSAGRVVAADLDPRFLGDLRAPNVEVRRCDITQDEIEPASYDLVHSRAVAMHMNDPADVLRRMVTALRPGGWLIAEDPDYGTVESLDPAHPLGEAFHACFQARIEFLAATNVMDLRYGRVLPVHMESLGLIELGNEAATLVDHGGSALSRFWVHTWQLTDDGMIANGAVTQSQVVDARRALEDPTFIYRGALMQAAWGRRS